MRGYLHPPVTGDYTFWIASDNSSELWLSTDENPSGMRQIAFISRFNWVAPREWTRYPSQRSEPIPLKAGRTYYIEALQEQTTVGDHLAAAWMGPSFGQSLIGSPYLSPCREDIPGDTGGSGILREYWTNYPSGNLAGLGGARPFASVLTVRDAHVSVLGPGLLPTPERISLGQPLKGNYRWVQVEGLVKFAGTDGRVAVLELSDGQAQVQVRFPDLSPGLIQRGSNVPVRIEGVCEAYPEPSGALTPGIVWASGENSLSFIENLKTNASLAAMSPASVSMAASNANAPGFYGFAGVVTFNDHVLGNDYIFVQADTTVVSVNLAFDWLKQNLKVGEWVELGGALRPHKDVAAMNPLVVTERGWRPMPPPVIQPLGPAAAKDLECRWSELEGVVHAVNSNGTVSIVSKDGTGFLWLSQTPAESLPGLVDAKVRARGVLLLTAPEAPLLLVPSRDYLDVVEEAPAEPLAILRRSIAELTPELMQSSWFHRVKVDGQVTFCGDRFFYLQDESGGIRVQTAARMPVEIGDTVSRGGGDGDLHAAPAQYRVMSPSLSPIPSAAPPAAVPHCDRGYSADPHRRSPPTARTRSRATGKTTADPSRRPSAPSSRAPRKAPAFRHSKIAVKSQYTWGYCVASRAASSHRPYRLCAIKSRTSGNREATDSTFFTLLCSPCPQVWHVTGSRRFSAKRHTSSYRGSSIATSW